MVVTGSRTAAAKVRHEDALTPDKNRTSAALAVVAAFLRPSEVKVLPQRVEQRRSYIHRQSMLHPVDSYFCLMGAGAGAGGFISRPGIRHKRDGGSGSRHGKDGAACHVDTSASSVIC
jgi:hypothetical protein